MWSGAAGRRVVHIPEERIFHTSTTAVSSGAKPIFGRPIVILLIVENNVPIVTYKPDETEPSGGLTVSAKIVGVDAIKKIATVELDPRPYGDVVDDNDDDAPDKVVKLDVCASAGRKSLEFPKSKPMGAQQFPIGLANGDVATYPVDAYDMQLSISS